MSHKINNLPLSLLVSDSITHFMLKTFELEAECQDVVYRRGHVIVFRNEKVYRKGTKYLESSTQLDAEVDGRLMDIKSVTKDLPFYRNALASKNKQLKHFNRENGKDADTVMLYFHDATFYSEEKIRRSIEELKNVDAVDKEGNSLGYKITIYIKHIYV